MNKSTIKAYYKLGRPINALAGCIAVILSGYVAGPSSWWPVVTATITVLIITVSTNAWNDYLDVEIDRINKPDRPLPSGQITPRNALIFSSIGTALSLVTAAFINPPAFLIALGANLLLYLYSWKLKCTVLFGNAAVAGIVALCFIFGGVAADNIQPVIILALTVFLCIMGREILKTMADYEGDRQGNCRTIATRWGKKTARLFMLIFLISGSLAMLAIFFVEHYHPLYLYLVLLIKIPLYTYVSIRSTSDTSSRELEQNSLLLKYGFFVWFIAVALGSALT